MPNSMICECTTGALEVSQDAMTPQGNGGDGSKQGNDARHHAVDPVAACLTARSRGTIVSIPEPASALLLLFGLTFVRGVRSRGQDEPKELSARRLTNF